MKFSKYLKDKLYVFLISGVCYGIILLIFFAFKIDKEVIIATSFIFAICISLLFLIDYLRKKKFYTELLSNIDALDKGYLVLETLRKPEFYEGELLYQALYNINKSMIENINIIDVRTYDDYIDGHIPFAIHVPFDSLEEHLVMFEKDKINVVYSYCQFCKKALKAAYMLAEHNYPVMVLSCGIKGWEKMNYDIIKTSNN